MSLGDKSNLEFETCLQKLQKHEHKIKTVLTQTSYRAFKIFIHNKILRVIDISKSVTKYIASPLKCLRANDEQFSVTSYSTKLKSKYDYEKPNFPSLPHSEVSSETSETWYR